MKTLIVYTSVHHQNTEKVAKVMAEELEADLTPTGDAQPEALATYDLIGFGSGIYFGKHHKTLLRFVETLPPIDTKTGVCVLYQWRWKDASYCPEGKTGNAGIPGCG